MNQKIWFSSRWLPWDNCFAQIILLQYLQAAVKTYTLNNLLGKCDFDIIYIFIMCLYTDINATIKCGGRRTTFRSHFSFSTKAVIWVIELRSSGLVASTLNRWAILSVSQSVCLQLEKGYFWLPWNTFRWMKMSEFISFYQECPSGERGVESSWLATWTDILVVNVV